MISAILEIIASLFRWFTGRKKDPESRQAVVEETNKSNKASADVARQTEQDIEHDASEIRQNTDRDAAAVRTGSLRDGADRINDAIDRANR